jgi:hypothetical protein
MINGRLQGDYINVSWAIHDTNPGDGGYCTIPGSHKVTPSRPAACPCSTVAIQG